jgi:hypothetical protein
MGLSCHARLNNAGHLALLLGKVELPRNQPNTLTPTIKKPAMISALAIAASKCRPAVRVSLGGLLGGLPDTCHEAHSPRIGSLWGQRRWKRPFEDHLDPIGERANFIEILGNQQRRSYRNSPRRISPPRRRAATGYNTTVASSAAKVADHLEEMFEANGSRGGFMIPISQARHRTPVINIIDHLVPELQRRGRFRTVYEGRTLRENLADEWGI